MAILLWKAQNEWDEEGKKESKEEECKQIGLTKQGGPKDQAPWCSIDQITHTGIKNEKLRGVLAGLWGTRL